MRILREPGRRRPAPCACHIRAPSVGEFPDPGHCLAHLVCKLPPVASQSAKQGSGSMAAASETHRQTFEDRLARIKQGGPNCMGHLHAGPSTEVRARDAQPAARIQPARAPKRRRGSPVVTLFLLPVAALLGALSMFVGRATAFHFFSDEGPYAFTLAGVPASMFADILIATVLAMILAWSFQMTWGLRRAALVAGFVAMMVGEFDLMQTYPDLFETVFSETYVAGALADPPATLGSLTL